jgi:hypothetical protein
VLRNWSRFQQPIEEDNADHSEPSFPDSPPFRPTKDYQAIADAGMARIVRKWDHVVRPLSSKLSQLDAKTFNEGIEKSVPTSSGLPAFFMDEPSDLSLNESCKRPNSPADSLDLDADTASDEDLSNKTPPSHLITLLNKAEKELLEDVSDMRHNSEAVLKKPAVMDKYFPRALAQQMIPYPDLMDHITDLLSFEMYSIPARLDPVVMMARFRHTPSPSEAVEEPSQATEDSAVSDSDLAPEEDSPPVDGDQELSQPASVNQVAQASILQSQPDTLPQTSSADQVAESSTPQSQPEISPRTSVDQTAQASALRPQTDILPRPYSIDPADSPIPQTGPRRPSADLAPNPSPALSNDAGETPGNLTQLTERLEGLRADSGGVVPQSRFGTPALSPFATPARSRLGTPARSRFATPINADDDGASGVAGPSSSLHLHNPNLLPHADHVSTDPPPGPTLPLHQPCPVRPTHSLIQAPSHTLPIHSRPQQPLPIIPRPGHPRPVHPGHNSTALIQPPALDQPWVDIQPAYGAYVTRRTSRIQENYEENEVVGQERKRRTSDSESSDLKSSKKFRVRFDSMWEWPMPPKGDGGGNGSGPRKGSGGDGAVSG